ncbi:crossover junction endodeoxyribonuclease RuvC [Candidatus Dojkabacteria bacterium]|nr:crossover junction endodeoxyribonuclease RuvC [Candidatus Dojkabacteria bacterium]
MTVLGIDVGIAITGWAAIKKNKTNSNFYSVHGYGVIRTAAKKEMCTRLKEIYDGVEELIEKYSPNHLAIEDVFYFKNQKTVIKVGQARGVCIVAGANKGIEIYDYTPLQVKQAVTGYGRAGKKQVQKMVKTILGLKEEPKPDDAADALAVAICHLNTVK